MLHHTYLHSHKSCYIIRTFIVTCTSQIMLHLTYLHTPCTSQVMLHTFIITESHVPPMSSVFTCTSHVVCIHMYLTSHVCTVNSHPKKSKLSRQPVEVCGTRSSAWWALLSPVSPPPLAGWRQPRSLGMMFRGHSPPTPGYSGCSHHSSAT